jgi:hypothetical protein
VLLRLTEGATLAIGRRGLAFLIGFLAMAAGSAAAAEEYVIWRSTTLDRFDWTPGSFTYASREACDEAVAVRRGRVARAVEFLRRIGADDTMLRLVGDRVYECRPALTRAPSEPSRSEPEQSP